MALQNSRKDHFIQQVNEIIEANLSNERFGVSELARELHMSRSNLHRRIKSASDNSVSQYLKKIRLNKALELLHEDSFTISEVSFRVGFGSPAYFTKCFRDQYGFPPGEVSKHTLGEEAEEEITEAEKRDVNRRLLHNFPLETTSFIGREREIEEIVGFIQMHRIVSLIGSGGCGKTRLACEVAAQCVREYKDGLWFVDLSPVESEELVLKQLMTTLEIVEIPGRDMMEVLIERIRDKKLLILLDNCEHLVRVCAELTGKLVESVPDLSMFVTSREALNIKGERVWVVPPLTLIDPAAIMNIEHANSSESVRLFCDRSLLHNPNFKFGSENVSDVATICTKVDGIPLAIELVASRIRHMDPSTMLERLGDNFAELASPDPRTIERHKTLHATIEWSYNLLKEDEKILFRRLSVFTGGFDLTAVEEVCAYGSLPEEKILDLLSRLIDTCMIQTYYRKAGQMRYRMLETLRQFGSKLLIGYEEVYEISLKHLEYFTRIAEQAYDERMSSQARWVEKIRQEHNNMLAALGWAELHVPKLYVELAANLSWYWGRSNDYAMAMEILEKVLTLNIGDRGTKARLDCGYGSLLVMSGDFQKGLILSKHGLSLWQELGNKKEESLTLGAISDILFGIGDNEGGLKYAKESYALAVELNDPGVELSGMAWLTFGLVALKKTEEARPMCRKVLKMAKELENLYMELVGHHMLGDCALMDGIYKDAEREYGEGVKTTLKSGDIAYTCIDMCGVAMGLAGQGRHAKALRVNAAATSKAKSFGSFIPEDIPLVFWHELVIKLLAGTREKLGEELTKKYEEEGQSMSFEEAVAYTLDLKKD
jgi:predicted ATPase/AraC-like DNA-binding protein